MAATVEKGDIYVIFDKNVQNLKAVGLMDNASTIIKNELVNRNLKKEDAKADRVLKYKVSTLVESSKNGFNVGDAVLVEHFYNSIKTFVPGKIESIDSGKGEAIVVLYKGIYDKKEFKSDSSNEIKITEIPFAKLKKNIPVEDDSWGKGTRITHIFKVSYLTSSSSSTTPHKDFIANELSNIGITINDLDILSVEKSGDKFNYLIQRTGYSTNIRIPYEYAVVKSIGNIEVKYGGKNSKGKTRKNTMPLQYAPGAKRAYLKRRKSSRK